MSTKHASFPRGLAAAAKDPNIEGARFGRLFSKLPAGHYGCSKEAEDSNLQALANAMVSSFDAPKDWPDAEESGIPALYTYLGQFIDHDLTFDPTSSFMKRNDADGTNDFRTPAFDLDNLYGRGPGDQPYMYEDDGKTLKLGNKLTLGSPGARDLQRNSDGRALIGDPRNDENAIVSQLQGIVMRFHNAQVAKSPDAEFSDIQTLVQHHYQYVVVNDFLARVVSAQVLDKLKTNGCYDRHKIKFFRNFAPGLPYMPLEFSVAAYRFGHSMVRPGYRLNDANLVPIFPPDPVVAPGFPEGLTGFRQLISNWGIDWGRYIDVDIRSYGSMDLDDAHKVANFKRLQLAYRIDTALVDPLSNLPLSVAGNAPPSLALRNLQRGVEFRLPTGQHVAAAMGVQPLHDDQISIGQGVDGAKNLPTIASIGDGGFKDNCPLWTYVLAEAMVNEANPDPKIPVTENKSISTPQLGPVGGRLVAEVFLGLLFADKGSYLNMSPDWTPPGMPGYQLKDLVADALAA